VLPGQPDDPSLLAVSEPLVGSLVALVVGSLLSEPPSVAAVVDPPLPEASDDVSPDVAAPSVSAADVWAVEVVG
jgi:hypothetical protein